MSAYGVGFTGGRRPRLRVTAPIWMNCAGRGPRHGLQMHIKKRINMIPLHQGPFIVMSMNPTLDGTV